MKKAFTKKQLALHLKFHKEAEAAWLKAGGTIEPRTVPSLATVLLAQLLESRERTAALVAERNAWLNQSPEHWATKLSRKLDRQIFPELPQGDDKLDEGNRLARLIQYLKIATDRHWFSVIRISPFGKKVAARLHRAAFDGDEKFIRDFADGSRPASPLLRVYQFMLAHTAAVERCQTCAEIQRLSSFPEYSPQSFCRLCREIGLPLRKRSKR